MTKEEIFKEYTNFIEHLVPLRPLNGNDKKDRAALLELNNKSDKLLTDMKGLNSCDMLWFSECYGKWYAKDFYPKYKGRIESLEGLEMLKKVRNNLTMAYKDDRVMV